MVNNSNSRFAAAYGAARTLVLSLVACVFAASVAASPAQAAEVDALGAPAPIGFADVVERVKPGVVFFKVNRTPEYWNDIAGTGTIAIYQPIDPQGVTLHLYAVDPTNLQ